MMKKISFVLFLAFTTSIAFAQNLGDFVGTYNFSSAPFAKINISQASGKLIADAEGVGTGELQNTNDKNKFLEPNNNAELTFVRDTANVVVKLNVFAQGTTFVGVKNLVNEYAGIYNFDETAPFPDMKVTFKDGKLSGETAQGNAELKASNKKDQFEIVGYGGTAVFSRNEAGQISNVVLNVQGLNLKAVKK